MHRWLGLPSGTDGDRLPLGIKSLAIHILLASGKFSPSPLLPPPSAGCRALDDRKAPSSCWKSGLSRPAALPSIPASIAAHCSLSARAARTGPCAVRPPRWRSCSHAPAPARRPIVARPSTSPPNPGKSNRNRSGTAPIASSWTSFAIAGAIGCSRALQGAGRGSALGLRTAPGSDPVSRSSRVPLGSLAPVPRKEHRKTTLEVVDP